MKNTAVAISLLLVVIRAAAAETNLCPSRSAKEWVSENPRARAHVDGLRLCGALHVDHLQPDAASVLVWDAGTAPWAQDAAMIRSGVVSIQRREQGQWTEIRRLRSPLPMAYGEFGRGIAASARWLAVLARRPQRIWVYDLSRLSAPPTELADARDFAQSLAMAGDQILVGGNGEMRIYHKGASWTLAERVPAPAASERVFTGQIMLKGDLLVSLAPGLDTGDGLVFPGRVDVFRRAQNRWHWEARLTPDGKDEPFGYACCVEIENGRISTTFGKALRFVKQASGWRSEQVLP